MVPKVTAKMMTKPKWWYHHCRDGRLPRSTAAKDGHWLDVDAVSKEVTVVVVVEDHHLDGWMVVVVVSSWWIVY
jgi:hypothetical protein